MKFPRLIIDNFLAITHAELNLADRGLMLVQGVNNDDTSALSNGAGKSSLADALCWCLYGVTARGASGDDVINNRVGKNCRVEVHVEDGHCTYVITRHRKHKTGKNSLTVEQREQTIGGAKVTDLTKGTDKLTQVVVNKIIGASYDVFAASVYSGYEQMPNLPAMTDKNLKVMIEEASGMTLLEQAYEEARERLGKAKTALADAENERARKQQELASLEAQHKTALTDQADWKTQQTAKIQAETANLKALHASYTAMAKKAAALDRESLEKEIDQIKVRLDGVTDELRSLARLEKELNDIGIQLSAVSMDVERNRKVKTNLEQEVANVDHKIGCPCAACGRPLTEAELATTRQKAVAALEDQKVTLAASETRQNQLIAAQKAKKEEIEKFKASMTDVSVESRLAVEKAKELAEVDRQLVEVQNAASQVKRLAETIKAMQAEPNPFDAIVERLAQQIEKVKNELVDADLVVVDAMEDLEVASVVVQVFGPAGVRAVILDEVTPYLNQQTAKYLSILSDGNITATWSTLVPDSKGNLKEKFTIEVANSKGAHTFSGLSGGQKRKVRLATALALQDLVATRAVKPIDLYIGDEIDDALDDAGLERLTQILDEKANERGTVLIISHKSLTDWIANVIQIEMQPGGETRLTEMTV